MRGSGRSRRPVLRAVAPAVAALAAAVALGACGAGAARGRTQSPAAPSPSGASSPALGAPSPSPGSPGPCGEVSDRPTIRALAFDRSCLAVPAGRPLRIRIANDDPAVQHNLAIYDADPERVPAARRLFAGELIVGPASTVYTAPALPAGTYAFRCEVHSTTMRGVLLAV